MAPSLPARNSSLRGFVGRSAAEFFKASLLGTSLLGGLLTVSLTSGCSVTGPGKSPEAQGRAATHNMIEAQKRQWQEEAKRQTVTFSDIKTPRPTDPSANPYDAGLNDPRNASSNQRGEISLPERPAYSARSEQGPQPGMSRQLADLRDQRSQPESEAGLVKIAGSRAAVEPLAPQTSREPLEPLSRTLAATDSTSRPPVGNRSLLDETLDDGIQQVAFYEDETDPAARPVPVQRPETPEWPGRAIPRDDRPVDTNRFAGSPSAGRHPLSPISHTTSPRIPQPGEVVCPTGTCPTILGPFGPEPIDPTEYPDEYLCDGGDRGMPFHYEGAARSGLDTEDTIGEFKDETGKARSAVSSKVCIYAPRFAAVRSKTAPAINEDLDIIAAAHDGVQIAGIDTRLGIEEQTQRNSLARLDTSARASGIRVDAWEGSLDKVDIARGLEERLISYQSLSFIQEGRLRQNEEPILYFGAQAAASWSRDLNPVIAAHESNGHELQAEFKVRNVTGIEDRRAPGELRIVKLADKEVAKPGDIITFTIRFDNLGGRDLFDVTIVDNLTPRMQYIPGSVDCNLPGTADATDNGEGSVLLTFKFDDPLKGQTGGSITFKCRVN
ncbi:MAG: hypothetical protein R3C01_06080 [Planctomycetaceae bacterium]